MCRGADPAPVEKFTYNFWIPQNQSSFSICRAIGFRNPVDTKFLDAQVAEWCIQSAFHIHGFPTADQIQFQSVVVDPGIQRGDFIEKDLRLSGPVYFKPVLFKD